MESARHSEFCRPNGKEVAGGIQFISVIGEELDFGGTIFREPGVPCWDFYSDSRQSPYSSESCLRPADLIFTTPEGDEFLCIRRSPQLRDTHYILQEESLIGSIKLTTALRNEYELQLGGTTLWRFHLPLFDTCFHGESDDGKQLWAKLWKSRQQWRILVQPDVFDSTISPQRSALLPALAFIHRQWWCFS